MATGALDTNGIWQYGEDDSNPTFSELLNRLGGSTSTAVGELRLASPIKVANATARNAEFPSPVQGNTVFRNDLGLTETYYAAYNASTNPGGATPAGWYPEKAYGIVHKKNTALSLTAGTYNNVSNTANWDAVGGSVNVGAYNNGWSIPFTGFWKITTYVQGLPAAQTYTGFRINNSTAPGTWSQLYGGIALASSTNSGTSSTILKLNANDVLTLFIYTAGTANWPTETTLNAGMWAIEFVAPAK